MRSPFHLINCINKIFQILILCREKLERLPGASVLVRILQAPFSPENKVLSLADIPRKDWETKKVMIPRPHYETSVYNTSLYPVNDSERTLFDFRQQREKVQVREAARSILENNKIIKIKVPYLKASTKLVGS